jgi:hypothetical protein
LSQPSCAPRAAFFGLRTYGSFMLLRSAYEAGAPMTSSIRPWMTLQYVATTYRTSNAALIERLGLTREQIQTRA